MKKSTISLITSALFLSIAVHAAPVAHNNNATAQVKSSDVKVSFVVIVIGAGVAVMAGGFAVAILEDKDRKKVVAKKRKKKAVKKAAKAALRKRAEAEYAHRHMPHKWKML
jgi:hypothetical protein